MKELISKIIQIGTAIVASYIVVCGDVHTQQVSCSTILNACIPSSNRILFVYANSNFSTTSQAYNSNNQRPSDLCSKNILADFSAGETCCETGGCDGNIQSKHFSLSFIQDFYSLQKNVSSFDAGMGSQTKFESHRLRTSLKAVPIYIVKQSIIC